MTGLSDSLGRISNDTGSDDEICHLKSILNHKTLNSLLNVSAFKTFELFIVHRLSWKVVSFVIHSKFVIKELNQKLSRSY